mgnify:CR=1 FL=1
MMSARLSRPKKKMIGEKMDGQETETTTTSTLLLLLAQPRLRADYDFRSLASASEWPICSLQALSRPCLFLQSARAPLRRPYLQVAAPADPELPSQAGSTGSFTQMHVLVLFTSKFGGISTCYASKIHEQQPTAPVHRAASPVWPCLRFKWTT